MADPDQDDREHDDGDQRAARKRRVETSTREIEATAQKDEDDAISNDPLLNKQRFENRRMMAWVSLGGILVFTTYVVVFMKPESVQNFDFIFGWVYTTLSGIVFTYMGTTTYGYTKYLQAFKKKTPT